MEEFALVEEGGGSLTFFDRKPADRRLPLAEYRVRLEVTELTAGITVWAINESGLLELFEDLARHWRTASETLEWTSRESDFGINVVPDRLGHFEIEVSIGVWTSWHAKGPITIVTAQLDEVVTGLKSFFGKMPEP